MMVLTVSCGDSIVMILLSTCKLTLRIFAGYAETTATDLGREEVDRLGCRNCLDISRFKSEQLDSLNQLALEFLVI